MVTFNFVLISVLYSSSIFFHSSNIYSVIYATKNICVNILMFYTNRYFSTWDFVRRILICFSLAVANQGG